MPGLPDLLIHYVDAENWAAVAAHGLRPASSLLADAGLAHEARRYRPSGLRLPTGAYLRDQAPMPPAALARCLDPPLQPADWYELVNAGIYFWADPDRAKRHERALRTRPQIRMVFSTERLLRGCDASSFVTPFNVGAARRNPAPRGARTFVPLRHWRAQGWEHERAPERLPRPRSHLPAELVVRQDLPCALDAIVSLEALPASSG